MKLRTVIADLLDILFPTSCVGCGMHLSRGALLCSACEAAVPAHRTFFCSVCLARMPAGPQRTEKEPPPNIRSACHPEGFTFGAATDYRDDAVRELILALKFRSARAAAEPLGRFLARYIRDLGIASPDILLVPLPLSRRRERTRGFNQAELIAHCAGAELGASVVSHVLRRTRDTRPQSDIHERRERAENVRGAFAMENADAVGGRVVILVDDVRTSGATLAEAVAALRTAQPARIYALVVARA
jgi:ComF family protein